MKRKLNGISLYIRVIIILTFLNVIVFIVTVWNQLQVSKILYLKTYIQNTFKTTEQSAATITSTLIVFISGYIITILITTINGIIQRYKIRKLFKVMILKVAERCKMQHDNFLNYSLSLNTENIGSGLSTNEVHQLKNLDEIGFKTVYDSFFSFESSFVPNRVLTFEKVWNGVNLVSLIETKHPTEIKDFQNKLQAIEDNRQKSIEDIQGLILEIIRKQREAIIEFDVFLERLSSIEVQISSHPRLTPKIVNDIYINQLMNILPTLTQNEYVEKLFDKLSKAILYYRTLESILRQQKTQANYYASHYKALYKMIKLIYQ